jgi:hypothetical protein
MLILLTPLLVFSPTAEIQEMESSFHKLHTLGIPGELLVRTPTTAKKEYIAVYFKT